MAEKPPFGSPCNNCGQCCADQLCPLARMVTGLNYDAGPCPALSFDGDQSSCDMVTHPERWNFAGTLAHGKDAMSKAALFLIGAGFGCDGQLEGEVVDPVARKIMRAGLDRSRIKPALKLWRLSQ